MTSYPAATNRGGTIIVYTLVLIVLSNIIQWAFIAYMIGRMTGGN